jgi:hypothetical protein
MIFQSLVAIGYVKDGMRRSMRSSVRRYERAVNVEPNVVHGVVEDDGEPVGRGIRRHSVICRFKPRQVSDK